MDIKNQLKQHKFVLDEDKIVENRKKEEQRGERGEKQASVLLEVVKSLALTGAEMNSLKSEQLVLQLECHREIDKRRQLTYDSSNRGKNDGGDSSMITVETGIPLKSHMKNKSQRIPELGKALTRFHARGETRESASQLLSLSLESLSSKNITVGDHLYESDDDDL